MRPDLRENGANSAAPCCPGALRHFLGVRHCGPEVGNLGDLAPQHLLVAGTTLSNCMNFVWLRKSQVKMITWLHFPTIFEHRTVSSRDTVTIRVHIDSAGAKEDAPCTNASC